MPSLIDTIRHHYWTSEGPDAAERACCGSGTPEDVRVLRKGLLDIAALIWRTPTPAQPSADGQQTDMQVWGVITTFHHLVCLCQYLDAEGLLKALSGCLQLCRCSVNLNAFWMT